jgi:hypothetical protein
VNFRKRFKNVHCVRVYKQQTRWHNHYQTTKQGTFNIQRILQVTEDGGISTTTGKTNGENFQSGTIFCRAKVTPLTLIWMVGIIIVKIRQTQVTLIGSVATKHNNRTYTTPGVFSDTKHTALVASARVIGMVYDVREENHQSEKSTMITMQPDLHPTHKTVQKFGLA